MLKTFILLNSVLLLFHLGVVFAMVMGMSQVHTNQEIVDNLYWMIPLNLLFASIPNLLIVLAYVMKKHTENLFKTFIAAELYAVLIQAVLHAAVLAIYLYAPAI